MRSRIATSSDSIGVPDTADESPVPEPAAGLFVFVAVTAVIYTGVPADDSSARALSVPLATGLALRPQDSRAARPGVTTTGRLADAWTPTMPPSSTCGERRGPFRPTKCSEASGTLPAAGSRRRSSSDPAPLSAPAAPAGLLRRRPRRLGIPPTTTTSSSAPGGIPPKPLPSSPGLAFRTQPSPRRASDPEAAQRGSSAILIFANPSS
jgi:hypothetical protein